MSEDILGNGGEGSSEGQNNGSDGGAGNGTQDTNIQAGANTNKGDLPKWHGVLPKDYQGHAALEGVEGMDDMLKRFVSLKSMEGKKVIPDKDASDEEKAAFLKELGVPEKASQYEGDIHDVYKQLFHNAKLTTKQAQILGEGHKAILAEVAEAEAKVKAEALEKAKDILKSKYKGDYDKNIAIAKKAFDEHSNEEAYARLKEKGFTSDPDVIEFLYSVGRATLDDSGIPGSGASAKKERPVDAMGRKTFDFSGTKA